MCVVIMALMVVVRTIQTAPARTITAAPAMSEPQEAPHVPLPAGPRKFQ
jgi:hypothetical protein